MESINNVSTKKKRRRINKGSWTSEEDRKLAETIAENGPKRWTLIASKAGLGRCGKSCRLRWMNYLRPNIKRGNISDQEEDLILRLHKLLGNRWSLIAGRLPGRTDNEIKNYWNSHLSKKCTQMKKKQTTTRIQNNKSSAEIPTQEATRDVEGSADSSCFFNVDDLFDFSSKHDDSSFFDWLIDK